MYSDERFTTALAVYSEHEDITRSGKSIERIFSKIKSLFIQRYKLLGSYFLVSIFGLFISSVYSSCNHNLYYLIYEIIPKYNISILFTICLSLSFVLSFTIFSNAYNIVLCFFNSCFIGTLLFFSLCSMNFNTLYLLLASAFFDFVLLNFFSHCSVFSREYFRFQRSLKQYFVFFISFAMQVYLLYLLFSLLINLFMLG